MFCRIFQSDRKINQGKNQMRITFRDVPLQYVPSFQNVKVDWKSKTTASIADDCAIFMPNF